MVPKRSMRGLADRLFSRTSRADRRLDQSDLTVVINDAGPRRRGLDHEPGEAFLVLEVARLLRREADHLPGAALTVGPHGDGTTAASVWRHAMADGRARSPELDASLARVLGRTVRLHGEAACILALDLWLQEGFADAQARLATQPLVWHIVSDKGAFQAFVDTSTFDSRQAERLRSEVVRPLLERLRMDVWLVRRTDPVRASELRNHVREVEDLDQALFALGRQLRSTPFARSALDEAGVLDRRQVPS